MFNIPGSMRPVPKVLFKAGVYLVVRVLCRKVLFKAGVTIKLQGLLRLLDVSW